MKDERLQVIIKFFDDVSALMDLAYIRADLPSYFFETVYEPPTDVFELEDKIYVVMELPGVNPQDLQIAVGPTMVVVRGTKLQPALMKQALSFYNLEISYGYFRRQLYLPTRIVVKATSVSFDNGVLKIELLKEKQDVKIIRFND
ncbi:MAG: Hsp20/alpha crystallin family protein [candidate division WOR-3 bacterium]